MTHSRIVACLLLCALAISACRSNRSASAVSKPESAPLSPIPTAPRGIVRGTVLIAAGAALPAYPAEMMFRQVLAVAKPEALPEECPAASDADRQPVGLTDRGGLTGVLVTVSDFSRSEKRPPIIHDISIKNCRLSPELAAAAQGDSLRLHSDSMYPFMPELGAASMAQTLIRGQERVIPLDRAGVWPLLCGFTAPCGRTDVVVLYHSLFAVTDSRGEFRIEKIPAGETVTINAWHPLFRASNLKISLQAGETREVELSLAPLEQYLERPRSEGRDKPGKNGAALSPLRRR